jgi:hypothetical protein
MIKSRLLAVFVFGSAILPLAFAHSAVLQVTESEGDRYGYNNEKVELFFSVYNTYNDIREFAVGNNGAFSAGYRNDLAQTPTAHLTEAFVVHKVNGSWKAPNGSELTWMNQATNFDSFTIAFLYTSKCGDCSEFNGFLEVGTTDGYAGDALDPQSPFAAFSESSGVITGSTTVPVPAAIWLFGSGLLGITGIARRKAA